MTNKVALCAIAKCENNYIAEWADHYENLGFDKIFIYDNNDINGEIISDVARIKSYIEKGFIDIINARGEVSYQTKAYTENYRKNFKNFDWIAYFDIDEFLTLDAQYKDIKHFLSNPMFEQYNCIKICWKQYTDSNHLKVTNENYSIKRFNNFLSLSNTNCSGQSKSIFRTVFDESFNMDSPHGNWSDNVVCCNTRGLSTKNQIIIKPTWINAHLKHFRFKTIEEYIKNKVSKGWPTLYGNGGIDKMDLNMFFMFNVITPEKTKYAEELWNEIKTKIQDSAILINGWNNIIKNITLENINLGDDLNYSFLSKIMPHKLLPYRNWGKLINEDYKNRINYSFIGSVISKKFTNANTIIWGAGIKNIDLTDGMLEPKEIHAVRGPLTRKVLLDKGFECPEIYGDPALLLPLYYKPKIEKKYNLGIIKHFRTKRDVNYLSSNDVTVIEISKYTNWLDVIDKILSCKNIASESLHGLIIAEAYGIPNLWIDLELEKLEQSRFKFHDFFQSIGSSVRIPHVLQNRETTANIFRKLLDYKQGHAIDHEKLIKSCPIKLILPDVPIGSRL